MPGKSLNLYILKSDDSNILTRILYWDYALDLFLDSPLLGAGFGRYNDQNLFFNGVKHVVYLATDGLNKFEIFNAANIHIKSRL